MHDLSRNIMKKQYYYRGKDGNDCILPKIENNGANQGQKAFSSIAVLLFFKSSFKLAVRFIFSHTSIDRKNLFIYSITQPTEL